MASENDGGWISCEDSGDDESYDESEYVPPPAQILCYGESSAAESEEPRKRAKIKKCTRFDELTGNGTPESPFQIGSVLPNQSAVAAMRRGVNKYLSADIDDFERNLSINTLLYHKQYKLDHSDEGIKAFANEIVKFVGERRIAQKVYISNMVATMNRHKVE